MERINNQAIFIFFTALILLLIYYLAPILTPFLFGTLLAYLTDPLVKILEKKGLPHLLSVIIVFFLIILIFLLFILTLRPLIQNQIELLIIIIPQMINRFQEIATPWFHKMISMTAIKSSVSASMPKAGDVVSTVLHSGYTVLEMIMNFVLTPIVTFYLLRDWDKVCEGIKNLLPEKYKPTILQLAREYDEVLGAFFRGQLLIMFALSIIYGMGLTIVGLDAGFMIGLIGGMLSIVPYLGSLFVIITSLITAVMQFQAWQPLIWVFLVFFVGQVIEAYILTPYLIGERIGLHPVAVIFAIMAGGTLFGFFGVLLALPIAALLMVLFRHARHRHRKKLEASSAKT